ncbi:NlpC/P60 family protein [Aurantimonas endophytica]|uniref:NlpC/P60 family putative phage cell wall peptidase n=1 Tax=Aurantimonas endophytica TaxID=1522175 RepID=A0A7W6MQN3_9HYPH|nr:NlpC/P60 family protein [Aurantimonas endophytica]MBB4004215.1 NlpC/P60 family putative phage cell wall peptidase [Aurantimonas endophytica]MCO6405056.1 peptidase P60 [Aurantimonas endophytica]
MSAPRRPAEALGAARGFLGTPYRHQGSRRGIGCDCLGLVRGVWRELYGKEPEDPGPYRTDWAVRGGPDRLMEAARRHLVAVPAVETLPGDVLLFRWRDGAPASHCGIVEEGGRVIHAYEGAAVVSSSLPHAWSARIAGAFRFPE